MDLVYIGPCLKPITISVATDDSCMWKESHRDLWTIQFWQMGIRGYPPFTLFAHRTHGSRTIKRSCKTRPRYRRLCRYYYNLADKAKRTKSRKDPQKNKKNKKPKTNLRAVKLIYLCTVFAIDRKSRTRNQLTLQLTLALKRFVTLQIYVIPAPTNPWHPQNQQSCFTLTATEKRGRHSNSGAKSKLPVRTSMWWFRQWRRHRQLKMIRFHLAKWVSMTG